MMTSLNMLCIFLHKNTFSLRGGMFMPCLWPEALSVQLYACGLFLFEWNTSRTPDALSSKLTQTSTWTQGAVDYVFDVSGYSHCDLMSAQLLWMWIFMTTFQGISSYSAQTCTFLARTSPPTTTWYANYDIVKEIFPQMERNRKLDFIITGQ